MILFNHITKESGQITGIVSTAQYVSNSVTVQENADEHERWMRAAIALGRRNTGVTWPNPSVGCILVNTVQANQIVVGRGTTAVGGRPHAEGIALEQAGNLARGATAYVTLEPCAHFGRTEPCALAMIEAGIKVVYIGTSDPDSRVAGKGIQTLEQAGIETVVGILEDECKQLHADHICRVTSGRPYIQLKMAISSDGYIGKKGAGQIRISSERSNCFAHQLRAQNDGIMIGIGTVLADDPSLTCRIRGLEDRSPIRIILDSQAQLPIESKLIKSIAKAPIYSLTSDLASNKKIKNLEELGVKVFKIPADDDGHVALPLALPRLAEEGLTRVMVEGGSKIANALIKVDLVDEINFVFGNKKIGEGGIKPLQEISLDSLEKSGKFSKKSVRFIDEDRVVHLLRRRIV